MTLREKYFKKTHEIELPELYEETMTISAKEKKFATILTIASLIITFPLIWVVFQTADYSGFSIEAFRICKYIFLASLVVYIVLHEIVHGLIYYALTKVKPTFGITLAAAYCGVPGLYVYRSTAIASLAGPLSVFSIIFGSCMIFGYHNASVYLTAGCLLAAHLGGCVGDIYNLYLYATKYKAPNVLMKDEGPIQHFYEKKQAKE